jgi:hypothetical protein
MNLRPKGICTLALFGCSLLSACMPGALMQGYQDQYTKLLRTQVSVEGSQFEPDVKILGVERPLPGATFSSYYLRSWVNKQTGATTHQLYVQHHYDGDWIRWTRANGQDAQSLEFSSLSREVRRCYADRSCSFEEVFGASIPHAAMRASSEGYAVKFYSSTGQSMVVTLDSDQIKAQLAAVSANGGK